MKATINNTTLLKITPQGKQYDIRDKKLKGFLIRVNPTGKMNYVCEFQRGKRINLGPVNVLSPAQARDKAKKLIGDAIAGINPHSSKNHKMTLKNFIDDKYKPWALTHRKAGVDAVQRIIRCFISQFGHKPLNTLTPLAIDEWRTNKLKTGCSTQTINRDVATLKAAISKAVEWDFIDTHPLSKLKLFKVDTSAKIRYLSKDEELNLRAAIDAREILLKNARVNANNWRQKRGYNLMPEYTHGNFADHIKPMILISINTGLRQGELFNLRWSNVDLTKKVITIAGDTAKSGKTRHVPLNEEAFNSFFIWRKQTSDFGLVFPSADGKKFNNVNKAWQNLLKTAQINNFRWHDLRHHFASRLVMADVDLNTVRELLGHSDIKMTLRYAHLAPEHKAAAVAKLVNF